MFDEKDLEAYRNTLPRAEVKARILDDLSHGINGKKTEKIIPIRFFPLIAACFVLILSAFLLLGTAHRGTLAETPSDIAVATARSVAQRNLRAEAQILLPTRITVSTGHLTVTDAETGEVLGEGTNLRVHGNVMICWQLETETEPTGVLTLSCLGFKNSYQAVGDTLIRTK